MAQLVETSLGSSSSQCLKASASASACPEDAQSTSKGTFTAGSPSTSTTRVTSTSTSRVTSTCTSFSTTLVTSTGTSLVTSFTMVSGVGVEQPPATSTMASKPTTSSAQRVVLDVNIFSRPPFQIS